MAYNPKDYYFYKAKKENFVARSVFKLEEMDQRHRLFKSGQKILDLGAAPGSWSQYVSKKVGPKGVVVGIDLVPIKLTMTNTQFFQKDLRDPDMKAFLSQQGFPTRYDAILSDMAPKTTGIRLADQLRSVELCDLALDMCEDYLLPEVGFFICKLFHSGEFEGFRNRLRKRFKEIHILRPQSTRKESKEIFFIAQKFIGSQDKA